MPTEDEKRAAFSAADSRVDLSPLMMPPAVEGRSSLFTILAYNAAGAVMHTGGLTFDATLRGPIESPAAQQRTSRARITDNLDGTYIDHVVPIAGTFSFVFVFVSLSLSFVLRLNSVFVDIGNGTYSIDVRAVGSDVSSCADTNDDSSSSVANKFDFFIVVV